LSRKSDVPVIRIPHNICPKIPESMDRNSFGLPGEGFLFVTMADFSRSPERENPLGAIEAYCRAFPHNTPGVFFVVKLSNSFHRPELMESIKKYMDENPSIILVEGHLERPQINALLNACDCYVSLHRSEGFGFPMAEAMYMGKPVIATGWSGNLDFMNISNSLLVSFEMKEIDDEFGPYGKGQVWADPDLDHAAQQMATVFTDEALAHSIGEAAAHEIRTNFCPKKMGDLMRERLYRIRRSHPLLT
jgi:glycosyltransferase involved in cell wall biosynthesis